MCMMSTDEHFLQIVYWGHMGLGPNSYKDNKALNIASARAGQCTLIAIYVHAAEQARRRA